MSRAVEAVVVTAALLLGSAAVAVEPLLEPGARGFARTAIQGTHLEDIPLSFIGTWNDFAGPGLDLYLVELDGPRAETIGVAAGMSGSPVYIDGVLIGALSYRLGALPKRPIAGVTPLRDVLDAARSAGSAAATVDGAEPIATPIAVSGVDPAVRAWLAERLESSGVVLTGGGRTAPSSSGDAPPPLRPGDPVGAQLVRGDASLAATGTVTWVDGPRVWAFGHPFLGEGNVELPMVTAEILHTLADLAGSTKLAIVGDEVGAFVDDRLSAIVGRTDRRARMMPLTVDVSGAGDAPRHYSYSIVRHERLLAPLTASMVANSLRANNVYSSETTLRLRGTVRFDGLPDLSLDMVAAGGPGAPDPSLSIAGSLFRTLGALATNRFVEPQPRELTLSVDVIGEPRRYSVDSIQYDRGRLKDGAPLIVRCALRAFRGETFERTIALELPDTLPRKTQLFLAVGNPSSIDRVMGGRLERRLNSAMDAATVIDVLGDRPSDDRLTAVVYSTDGAVVARGLDFPALPPTVEHLLTKHPGPAGADRGRRVTELARAEIRLDGPVTGGQQRRLRIERDGERLEDER